jgi:hypothetical protein
VTRSTKLIASTTPMLELLRLLLPNIFRGFRQVNSTKHRLMTSAMLYCESLGMACESWNNSEESPRPREIRKWSQALTGMFWPAKKKKKKKNMMLSNIFWIQVCNPKHGEHF